MFRGAIVAIVTPFKKGKLDDPKKIMRDVSAKGHWGNGDYEIVLKPGDNLDYLISLVKQSYNENT